MHRRQPREAVRQRREAEQAPARSVVVRYLHRVTRTMPLKQSRSAGKGLERLCRARSRARSGAPTGRRRRVVPVVVRQRGLPEASPRHVRRRRERLGRSGLGLPRLGARRRWSPSSWCVVNLGEVVTRFGRVLAVNCTQRAPTRPKEMPSAGELNDRCHWGPLGGVGASTRLITQRRRLRFIRRNPIEA